MGRGLSELQKQILQMVYERRKERDFGAEEAAFRKMADNHRFMGSDWPFRAKADATNAELLAALYDWPDKWGRRPSEHSEGRRNSEYRFYGQNFDRRRIGPAEYNRRSTSFYKAIGRLQRRGLLTRYGWKGVWITDEGMKEAEKLLASKEVSPSLA